MVEKSGCRGGNGGESASRGALTRPPPSFCVYRDRRPPGDRQRFHECGWDNLSRVPRSQDQRKRAFFGRLGQFHIQNGCCMMAAPTMARRSAQKRPDGPHRARPAPFCVPPSWSWDHEWSHVIMNVKWTERASFHLVYYCSHFDRVYFHICCNIFTPEEPLIRKSAARARMKLCHSLTSLSRASLVKNRM